MDVVCSPYSFFLCAVHKLAAVRNVKSAVHLAVIVTTSVKNIVIA